MEIKNAFFSEYYQISSKLKKKRILKKPNVTEASQQFENLGTACENDDLPQYAGMCYRAAANCQSSLGNISEQGNLFLKAYRNYMTNYAKYVSGNLVYTDENLHQALICYEECWDSFFHSKDPNIPNLNLLLAGMAVEMARALKYKIGRIEESIDEFKKALRLYEKYPVEKIYCLQNIITSKIDLEEYDDALKNTEYIDDELVKVPPGCYKDDVHRYLEITKILLLLILEPTPQQISPPNSSLLEKYAWVETSVDNEIFDIETYLKQNHLGVRNEKLFLILQSLVMACQYDETDNLVDLENELIPLLSLEQQQLVRVLVRKKLKK